MFAGVDGGARHNSLSFSENRRSRHRRDPVIRQATQNKSAIDR
jgi:hypothetical protein